MARAALVSDIELIDDYPTHFSAYSRRKHRWMRGDWQILRWLMPRVPDGLGPHGREPLQCHLALEDPRQPAPQPPRTRDAVAADLPAGSCCVVARGCGRRSASRCCCCPCTPVWRSRCCVRRGDAAGSCAGALATLRAFARQHLMVVLTLTFLLYDALLALDAIVRSLSRVFVTRKRLLEWETAAESRNAGGPKRAADAYLDWSPLMVLTLLAALAGHPSLVLPAAAPVLALLGLRTSIRRVAQSRARQRPRRRVGRRRGVAAHTGVADVALFPRVQHRGAQLAHSGSRARGRRRGRTRSRRPISGSC